MPNSLEGLLRSAIPADADFACVRYLDRTDENLSVRQDIPQPVERMRDTGVMVRVCKGGGMGYAATGDVTPGGLKRAGRRAAWWADQAADCSVTDFSKVVWPDAAGNYEGPDRIAWESTSLEEKFDLLNLASRSLKIGDPIVDWEAGLWRRCEDVVQVSSNGGAITQTFRYLMPMLSATANDGPLTQNRTLGGRGMCMQGGMEVLEAIGFRTEGERIAREALDLLTADNCPTGTLDLVLAPDQMILQIHESIGHPLERDRILGDERNYAGTSFVKPDMVGSYRYGTELLNVAFDPTRGEQFASYGYDDDGLAANKQYVIEKGILKRCLGGLISQTRSAMPGVANSRSSSWNRAPIDRMANLNLEPGQSTLDEMIASIGRGVYMKTNCSWSIDDSRNKFQFGCEWGRLIEDGKLTRLVRNCNYRGVSATFWRSLKMVGRGEDVVVMGTPHCGKGEPNQMISVGHASPPCAFENVQVFGGV